MLFLRPSLCVAFCLSGLISAQNADKYLMVFGDSYSSASSRADGPAPSIGNPLGNPQFPGQTTSGGLNWVGQAIAKLNSSLIFSYDFAVSGATIDKDIVDTWAGSGVDDQVDLFGRYVADTGDWSANNTLTVFWIGINDIGHPYWDGIESPTCKVMKRYSELLETLYEQGLRRFVLFTVPPFDNVPAFNNEPVEKVNKLREGIVTYNKRVEQVLETFKAAHEDVEGDMYDTAPAFRKAFENPEAYGAPDAKCVNADGVSCLWYDTYHPGIAIQKLVAEGIVEQTGFF